MRFVAEVTESAFEFPSVVDAVRCVSFHRSSSR